MQSNKLNTVCRSRRCIVKRRGRKSTKLAKSKTRRYRTKKRVYRGGIFGWSEKEKAEAEAAKAKAAAEAAKAKAAAEAAAATKAAAAAEKAAAAAKKAANEAAEAAEAPKAKAEAAKVEAKAAPHDTDKAFKAFKANAEAAKAEAAVAKAEAAAAAAEAVVENEKAKANIAEAKLGNPNTDLSTIIKLNAPAQAAVHKSWDAEKKAETAEKAAKTAAYHATVAEREYVKNQISQFSRTTLPFMKFLYAGASVPSDVELEYKKDPELKVYQIKSVDEVVKIDETRYKEYLMVFLNFMVNAFVPTMDQKMNKQVMRDKIVSTEFEQEVVEFTGFLDALIAIKEMSVEGRAAALPEALFEAFSKLSDPRYVMLIPESVDLGTYVRDHLYSYNKINGLNLDVNLPGDKDLRSPDRINALNSMNLWKLLSRNYYDFYVVIIDKMFSGLGKINFDAFIQKYNEWTLKKSDQKKIDEKANPTDDVWQNYSGRMMRKNRLYLRPFKEIGLLPHEPGYTAEQENSDTLITK